MGRQIPFLAFSHWLVCRRCPCHQSPLCQTFGYRQRTDGRCADTCFRQSVVRKEVAKRTKALTEAKRAVELERDSAMAIADTYESERDTALRQLREQKTGNSTASAWR